MLFLKKIHISMEGKGFLRHKHNLYSIYEVLCAKIEIHGDYSRKNSIGHEFYDMKPVLLMFVTSEPSTRHEIVSD